MTLNHSYSPCLDCQEKAAEKFSHLFPVSIFDILACVGVLAAAALGYLAHDELFEEIILCIAQCTGYVFSHSGVPSGIYEKVHGNILEFCV